MIPERIQRALDHHQIPDNAVSLLVQAVESDKPMLAVNEDIARNPASTIKVVTSYAALETLGPGYRWPTDIHLLGELNNGRLKGDLGIKGFGDPFLVLEDFWRLLQDLERKGLNHIDGDLLLDSSHFAPIDEDMGAFDGKPARTYNLTPSALMVNFQTVQFWFNDRGNEIQVDMVPDLPNLQLNNRLRPVRGRCGGFNAGIAINVSNPPERNQVMLDGRHPRGCKDYRLSRTVLQPESYFYGLFKSMWEQQGGSISGQYQGGVVSVNEDQQPFLRWRSRPFREILASTNKFSNNTMTRHLLLTMAAEEMGPPATTENGVQVIKNFLERRKIDTQHLVIDSGSGLSRSTRVSARLLADVLMNAFKSVNAPEFISSLPISGVDGTMRSRLRGVAAEGQAHLKTGRLDHVVALAGYVQARSGQRYVLVFMLNHKDVHRGIGNDIGNEVVRWLYEQ